MVGNTPATDVIISVTFGMQFDCPFIMLSQTGALQQIPVIGTVSLYEA